MTLVPPRPQPAPLNALRAFEAAYRLGGFAAAAEELSVTPGAVAAHIKSLEAALGAPLFHRRAQGVAPTALADAAASDFSTAFDALGAAMQRLRRAAARRLGTTNWGTKRPSGAKCLVSSTTLEAPAKCAGMSLWPRCARWGIA